MSAPRRALVTGASGFAGQWLARALLRAGWEVHGTTLDPAQPTPVLLPDERAAVRWTTADVRDPAALEALLDDARPDVIHHLAGITFVPSAGRDPGQTIETNVAGCARLLDAVGRRRRAGALDPLVLVTGSSEQYGRHDAPDFPLREEAELRPLTVYAASKVGQEAVALAAWRGQGTRVVCTRSFNHSGLGQAPQFVIPALVGRAVALRQGGGGRLPLGNTTTVRDFLHVADVVSAYILLSERGVPGTVYNVCGGRGTSVHEIALAVLARLGLEADLEPDPAFVRPVEVPTLIGDNRRLREATGWAPTLGMDTIIDELIDAATR